MTERTGLTIALSQVSHDLTELGRRFAVVGGLAVSVRAEIRFTRDVDLAVAVADDPDAEALVFALRDRSYEVRASVEQEATGRLATVRLLSPSHVKVDLLFASSGIEAEVIERAEWIEQDGQTIPIARAEELIALKVLSANEQRLQDTLDFRALVDMACPDLEVVCENLRLIQSRGFSRSEDLLAKLDSMLRAAHHSSMKPKSSK